MWAIERAVTCNTPGITTHRCNKHYAYKDKWARYVLSITTLIVIRRTEIYVSNTIDGWHYDINVYPFHLDHPLYTHPLARTYMAEQAIDTPYSSPEYDHAVPLLYNQGKQRINRAIIMQGGPWSTLQQQPVGVVTLSTPTRKESQKTPVPLNRLVGTVVGDVRDVLATSVSVGLSVALGLSMNTLIGSVLDRVLPGNPKNIQHQAFRVMALAVIIVIVTFLIARFVRPRVDVSAGPGALIQKEERQLQNRPKRPTSPPM